MILTITMNPSVDISYQLDNLSINHVNRTNKLNKTAGGKGLNVTRVLNQLNEQVVASGLKGGKLGEFLEQSLNDHNIANHFLKFKAIQEIVSLYYTMETKQKFLKVDLLLVLKK